MTVRFAGRAAGRAVGALGRIVGGAMVGVIRGYQLLLSPMLGARCRFYPSCSRYAADAIRTHGPVVGLFLGVRRLLRCHPWNPGGVDLVPPRGGVRAYVAHTEQSTDDHTHDHTHDHTDDRTTDGTTARLAS